MPTLYTIACETVQILLIEQMIEIVTTNPLWLMSSCYEMRTMSSDVDHNMPRAQTQYGNITECHHNAK
jgi:hypothetical protein